MAAPAPAKYPGFSSETLLDTCIILTFLRSLVKPFRFMTKKFTKFALLQQTPKYCLIICNFVVLRTKNHIRNKKSAPALLFKRYPSSEMSLNLPEDRLECGCGQREKGQGRSAGLRTRRTPAHPAGAPHPVSTSTVVADPPSVPSSSASPPPISSSFSSPSDAPLPVPV